jgi:hypothetical protein
VTLGSLVPSFRTLLLLLASPFAFMVQAVRLLIQAKRNNRPRAPAVATSTDQRLKSLAQVPPRTPVKKLPKEAPAIPKRMVTIKRPGSGPGTILLATKPTMAPITIQLMIPIAFLLRVKLFRVLLASLEAGDWIGV